MCGGILNILNAVFTEYQAPVRLGIEVVFIEYFFVYFGRLIKLGLEAKIVGAIKQICDYIIFTSGQSLHRAAVFTNAYCVAEIEFNISAAHFAFKDCHKTLRKKSLLFFDIKHQKILPITFSAIPIPALTASFTS